MTKRQNNLTALYRYFNADGELLYVGISVNAFVRMQQHSDNAGWFDKATRVTIEKFETREGALIAERNAIENEKPLFNVAYNNNQIGLNLGTHDRTLPTAIAQTIEIAKTKMVESPKLTFDFLDEFGRMAKNPEDVRYMEFSDGSLFGYHWTIPFICGSSNQQYI